jgi:AAA domain-containing protein
VSAEPQDDGPNPYSLDDSPFNPFEHHPIAAVQPIDPASFGARVAGTRVDLIARIRDGIPPIDYLPASEEMLIRGKRHIVPAPRKSGKSLGWLVHCTTMVEAGARVVILDRENGADLYARRLEGIVAALELDQQQLSERLAYYEFPRLKRADGDALASMCATADLVLFDSQRMFLSDLALAENIADDYAVFVAEAVEPLFRAGIATLILDNTGHEETGRSRGTTAKDDLNEVLFKLEVAERFGLNTTGRLRLTIRDSRFGNTGMWDMRIGGGVFEPWRKLDDEQAEGDDWKPTILMERVSRYLEKQHEPVSRTSIVGGVVGKRTTLFTAIDALIAEGCASETHDKHIKHVRKFPVPDQFPAVPGNGHEDPVPGSPSVGRNRNGNGSEGADHSEAVPGDDPEAQRLLELYVNPDADIPF